VFIYPPLARTHQAVSNGLCRDEDGSRGWPSTQIVSEEARQEHMQAVCVILRRRERVEHREGQLLL
jgi:hypothetical protein